MLEGPLVKVRDNFFSGYFARCIDNITTNDLPLDPLERAELCSLIVRAYGALHKRLPDKWEDELQNSRSPEVVRASSLCTKYWQSRSKDERREILLELKSLSSSCNDPLVRFMTATSMASETRCVADQMESLAFTEAGPLEIQLLRVAQFILIHRADLAGEVVKDMSQRYDESILSQLASAINAIVHGSYQEAYMTICDIIQVQSTKSNGSNVENDSVLLQNGKAVSMMQQQCWSEAQKELLAALEQDGNDISTISNLVVCSQWMADGASVLKYLEQLMQKSGPDDPLIRTLDLVGEAVTRFQANSDINLTAVNS